MTVIDNKKFNNQLELFKEIAEQSYCLDINYLKNLYFLNKNQFSHQEVKEIWQKELLNIKKDEGGILSLYISIPFCWKNKCKFCRHPSIIYNDKLLKLYLGYLYKTIEYYSDVFKKYKFNNLYIGGGTPSLLTVKQLEQLMSKLHNNFNFSLAGEKTVEINPASSSFEKLEIFKKFGVNRISIGVQSLNKNVLSGANRLQQTEETVFKAITNAKKLKFNIINVDLILGLKNDDLESLVLTCQKILEAKPSTVYIYKYKPQTEQFINYLEDNKNEYYKKMKKLSGDFLSVLKNEIAPKYQYLVHNSDDDFKLEADMGNLELPETRYSLYSDFAKHSILGLGQYAISSIYNSVHYEERNRNFVFEENKKNLAGVKLSNIYEISKFIFYCLEHDDSQISRKKFKQLFKKDIMDVFPDQTQFLVANKKLKIDDQIVYFLPEDIRERFIYSMFFVDESCFVQKK